MVPATTMDTPTHNANGYTCEDRTYYTYDNEDIFCKQGNHHCRPPHQARQGYSCGFCADDLSRDDVESEITDNVSNGFNCLCCDQEFGFKLALTKPENEKGKDRFTPGRRTYDDATYASSVDRSPPSLFDFGLLDDLAFKSKYRCGIK